MNLFTLASNGIVTRRNFIFYLFDRNATILGMAVFEAIRRYRKLPQRITGALPEHEESHVVSSFRSLACGRMRTFQVSSIPVTIHYLKPETFASAVGGRRSET
jgi:hypothetical protein